MSRQTIAERTLVNQIKKIDSTIDTLNADINAINNQRQSLLFLKNQMEAEIAAIRQVREDFAKKPKTARPKAVA